MKYELSSYNTKRSFAEALKELMREKKLSKITVSDLVANCGVNRKTFYYHFEDIYALLKWMLEEEAIEVVKNYDLLVDDEEAITFVLDYIEKNEYILHCALDCVGQEGMADFLFKDFESIVDGLVSGVEAKHGISLDPAYREFLCRFYTEGLAGILSSWLRSPGALERDTVIAYVRKTIRFSLDGIMDAEKSKAD